MAVAAVHVSSSASKCLVVGDGNFSFSILYAGANKGIDFLATSLDSEEKVKGTDIGSEFLLKAASVPNLRVLHGIDATRLKSYPEISSVKFDRIMFNFPHTGGKSNIKRNRQLIRDFLHSASEALCSRGEIWLALCNGQGGTPGDGSRTYNDSWKVVELAAGAGLLLSRIASFSSLLPPGYISTGYRSQSKTFNTEKALVHVFTQFRQMERPLAVPQQSASVCCMVRSLGSVASATAVKLNPDALPSGLRSYLLNPVHSQPWHPLHAVSSSLSEHLTTKFSLLHLWESRALLADRTEEVQSAIEECCLFGAHTSCYQELTRCLADLLPAPYHPDESEVTISSSKLDASDQVVLLPSGECLLPILLSFQKAGESLQSRSTGLQVLGKCVRNTCPSLSLAHQPISHELVCLLRVGNVGSHHPSQSSATDGCLKSASELLCQLIFPSRGADLVQKQIQVETVSENLKQLVFVPHFSAKEVCKDLDGCPYAFGFEHLVGEKPITLATCLILESTDVATTVGLVFKVDSITVLAHQLPDPRLIWSSEERFKSQFCKARKIVPFIPYSFYPVKYVHDVSFWIRKDERNSLWNEFEFFHLVRSICRDVVASVEQIDYHSSQDGSISVCFRVVYFSFDQVVSRSRAHDLQNDLRLAVREAFNVLLR